MSELAFDVMGEPVEFPEATEELRVRRFRNPGMRGACELVHDRDGAPLYISVDTGYLEFRTLVEGVPGRYRLDPVGEDRRSIAGAAPAYVTIAEVRNAAKAETSEQESVIRELARANAEMVKVMAEKFAEVMQAAAELLRAADGAGLSRREPIAASAPRNASKDEEDDHEDEDDDEDDDDLDDEEEPQKAQSPDLAAAIAQMLPMLQMWVMSKMAAPPTAPTQPAVAATETPPVTQVAGAEGDEAGGAPRHGGVPSAAQQFQLLAIYNRLEPAEKKITQLAVRRMLPDVRSKWLDELCAMTVEEAVQHVRSMIAETAPPARKEATSGEPSAGKGAGNAPQPVGVPTAAAHLMAIYGLLDPHEKKVAEEVARQMSPEVRAEWFGQVCAMSTADAVALIRSLVPKQGQPTEAAPSNGRTPKEGGRP